MKDCYKEAIRYFRRNPAQLYQAWRAPLEHEHGCLFWFCSPDRHTHVIPKVGRIGCPLMVAADREYVAWTRELTERCRREIPGFVEDLNNRSLNLLGELQDDMDLTIRNREWLRNNRYAAWEGSDTLMLFGVSVLPESEDNEVEET